MELMDVEQELEGVKICSPYDDIDKKVMNYLLSVRKLINHGLVAGYYPLSELSEAIGSLGQPVSKLTCKFSFVPAEERSYKAVSTQDVLDWFKQVEIKLILKLHVKMCINYCIYVVKSYEQEFDGRIILDLTRKLVVCLECFFKATIMRYKELQGDLEKFVTIILETIARVETKDLNTPRVSLNFTIIQVSSALHRILPVQTFILKSIKEFFLRLLNFLDETNAQEIVPDRQEPFSIFVTIVQNLITYICLAHPVETEEDEERAKEEKEIKVVLRNMLKYLPSYLNSCVTKVIDKIDVHLLKL